MGMFDFLVKKRDAENPNPEIPGDPIVDDVLLEAL